MAVVPSKIPTLLSKFQGCLVGAVLGDCIGSDYEGMPPQAVTDLLKKVEVFEKRRSDRLQTFTDDTAMARSVAASLICSQGFDSSDMAYRFSTEFFKEPFRGYGANVSAVFQGLKESGYIDVYRPASLQFNGTGSYGNGGAMRIAPAVLFAYKNNSLEKLKELVEGITRLTHTHIQAIQGSILQSLAVDLALREKNTTDLDTTKFIDALIKSIQPLEEAKLKSDGNESARSKHNDESSPETKRKCRKTSENTEERLSLPYTYKLKKIKDFLKDEYIAPDIINDILGTGIAALQSVPAAIYSFLRSLRDIEGLEGRNGLERTIILAISLGGDTDTIATMAAAIAGAYYGLEAIPELWQKKCEGVKEALIFAEDLCKLSET